MWASYGEIGHVTNGVHIPTWLAQEWRVLFTSLLGSDWKRKFSDASFWQYLHSIPDEVIWSMRLELNKNLQRFILQELRKHHLAESDADLVVRGALFDPNAFTIGFARRFATYKRATLLFSDPTRLSQLVNNPAQPVQIVFSGKAHPADADGQALIRDIWEHAADPRFRGKIFFLENYDMHSAKFLVSGADLWLNMPRVPLEASGTSGMKAAINGVPNCSVLDGWWCEGYNGKNGWAVGAVENATRDEQDAHDAEAIYRLLEAEIVPMYYDRDLSDIPRAWVQVVKESMASVIPQFTSERMLAEYIQKFYSKAAKE
jgi:starch phosphorylase